MITKEEIIKYLSQNKVFLKETYHCTQIGLFGSFARNEQTEESDVDILVEYEPNTPNLYDVEIRLKEHLKRQFNRNIDICTKKWINPVFKPLVLKETIYA
jgi:predicted nucleotidyltransferase